MQWQKTVGSALFVPAIACAAVLGIAAYFTLGSALAAGIACGTAAVVSAVQAWLIGRWRRAAGARLRNRELRAESASDSGLFADLLTESLVLLESAESEAQGAARARLQQETRAKVRQQHSRRLEAALDLVDQPLFVTGHRDELCFANAAARKLFDSLGPVPDNASRSDGENRGSTTEPAAASLSRFPVLARLVEQTRTRNTATDQRTVEFETDAGGTASAYRATATNRAGDDGAPHCVITVLEDISHERREKTRHAEFVSSVCHELKTPMASIKAFVEMLLDGDVPDADEQRELFGFIDAQVDRLTRLVNNMLNLSRIESGVIKLERQDCELNEVLEKALGVVRPTADEKQIRVVGELSDMYLAVHIDKDIFGQAVINLLSNAVKYTPTGGEVRLRSRLADGEAIIEVRDTGMGIPAASLPRIFERFYRVPENNKAASGTGLGLALVHYIVTELHNGAIAVESTVGVGSCFTVRIPLGHHQRSQKRTTPVREPALCP
jgi:two-component system phosphate regulon sensor histidine kinase PhoR